MNGVVQVLSLWQNHQNPSDVSGDGLVSPMDLLLLLNTINKYGPRELTPPPSGEKVGFTYDVNGDGNVTPIDAVMLVNCLNTGDCVAQPPVVTTASQPPISDQPSDPGTPRSEPTSPELPGNGGDDTPPPIDPPVLDAPGGDSVAGDPATSNNDDRSDELFGLGHLNDILLRDALA